MAKSTKIAHLPGWLFSAHRFVVRAKTSSFVLGLWVVAVAIGFGALGLYESRPGAKGTVPESRFNRTASALSHGDHNALPELLLFLHPKCPCSTATLEQLDRVLATAGTAAPTVTVWVYQPVDAAADFSETSLVARVKRLPKVVTHLDIDGLEARHFGARTSGAIRLYAAQGPLLFAGGITGSRGHSGDNPGADDLLAMIRAKTGEARSAPVYGCPLSSSESSR